MLSKISQSFSAASNACLGVVKISLVPVNSALLGLTRSINTALVTCVFCAAAEEVMPSIVIGSSLVL